MTLPGTLVFDYPSVSSMATYLHKLVAPPTAQLVAATPFREVASTSSQQLPVQITIASRLPLGYSKSETVAAGFDGICQVALNRWNLEEFKVRGPMWMVQSIGYLPLPKPHTLL